MFYKTVFSRGRCASESPPWRTPPTRKRCFWKKCLGRVLKYWSRPPASNPEAPKSTPGGSKINPRVSKSASEVPKCPPEDHKRQKYPEKSRNFKQKIQKTSRNNKKRSPGRGLWGLLGTLFVIFCDLLRGLEKRRSKICKYARRLGENTKIEVPRAPEITTKSKTNAHSWRIAAIILPNRLEIL